MADTIKIDKQLFQERLSHFISAWKADKRSGNDALFGGVGAVVVLMGRTEESAVFLKANALHVRTSYHADYRKVEEMGREKGMGERADQML